LVCEPCAISTFTSVSRKVECVSCPLGFDTDAVGATTCTACEENYYRGENDTVCVVCDAGFFASGTGNSDFDECPIGQWSFSGENCAGCPAGQRIRSIESIKSESIKPINSALSILELICLDCELSEFTNVTDSVACHVCDAGFDTNGLEGATECSTCAKDFFRNSTMEVCTDCPKGYLTDAEGSFECIKNMGPIIGGATVAAVAGVGGVGFLGWFFFLKPI